MYACFPDTPYFRSLKSIILENPLDFSDEALNENDQVDFTTASFLRKHAVQAGDTTFYINLNEIEKTSERFAEFLRGSWHNEPLKLFVSPSDFESLLRHICPSTSGLYQEEVRTETVCSLLSLGLKFNLQTVIDDCKSFLKSQKIKCLSVQDMVTIYQLFEDNGNDRNEVGSNNEKPMRSRLIKAMLEHEEQDKVLSMMLNGRTFSCVPIIRAAMKSLKDLHHTTSFVNSYLPIRCSCICSTDQENLGKRLFQRTSLRPLSPSLCGLICSGCNLVCCVTCQKEVCLVKINQMLRDYEGPQKIHNHGGHNHEDVLTSSNYSLTTAPHPQMQKIQMELTPFANGLPPIPSHVTVVPPRTPQIPPPRFPMWSPPQVPMTTMQVNFPPPCGPFVDYSCSNPSLTCQYPKYQRIPMRYGPCPQQQFSSFFNYPPVQYM